MAAGVRATLRRRFGKLARWAANTSWLVANLGFAATLAAAAFVDPHNQELIPFALVAFGFLLVIPVRAGIAHYLGRWRRLGVIEAEEHVLEVTHDDGVTTRVPLRDVDSVLRQGSTVWLSLADESLCTVEYLDEDDARELEGRFLPSPVFRLGKSGPQRGLLATVLLVLIGGATFMGVSILGVPVDRATPIAVYAGLIGAGWTVLFRRAHGLVVGVDGVRAGDTFFAYEALQQITSSRGKLALVLRDGRIKRFRIPVTVSMTRALDQFVQPRLDAAEASGEAFDRRTDESVQQWLKRVRRSFDETDFRQAVASKDVARELLNAPKAPPRVRVAVAAALAQSEPEYVEAALDGLADSKTAALAREAIEGTTSKGLERM